MKKILKWTGIIILIILSGTIIYAYPLLKDTFFTFEPKAIDEHLTVITGGGGNSGILASDSAVLVIDTKMGGTEKLFKLAKEKTGSKHIIVVNTHIHPDHTGGNKLFEGSEIIAGSYDKNLWTKLNGNKGTPDVWLADSMVISMGDETVTLLNIGQAHTFDDVVVYLHNRKLLFAGDIAINKIHPVMDAETGCNPDKLIAALQALLNRYEIKTVVPGHGDTGGSEIIANQIQYLEDMKAAAGNDARLMEAKKKYESYFSVPFLSSFDKVIKAMK